MGKSGYLPDISYNFGFFRTLAVNCLQKRDSVGARSALYNLNGCLGDEYLITINSQEYQKQVQEHSFYLCNYCEMEIEKTINKGEENEYVKTINVPREIPLKDITVFDLRLNEIQSLLLNTKMEKVWVCPQCQELNKMRDTKKINIKREKPFYLKIVPECPIKQRGLDRKFFFKFESWFWNFLEEINWQEVLYRKEYVIQHDGEDMQFKDKGDGTFGS